VVLKGNTEDYILANDEWKNDIVPEIMDGKNIADFIDPDIAEKLEALEREEETLEAEGFYNDHEDMVSPRAQGICVILQNGPRISSTFLILCGLQFDSDDEREAAAAKVALGHKLEAQSKKKLKNKARLPRTAGLRTLSDLTADLTKAGIDPSRVQERAVMIAKVRAAGRKRKRDEGEGEDAMDVDADADGDEGDGDEWASEGEDGPMDVDVDADGENGNTRQGHKRGKANSGAAIARKRAPRSNRQLAGLRDEAVRVLTFYTYQPPFFSPD
jgi:nucleolar GTP-binding protein